MSLLGESNKAVFLNYVRLDLEHDYKLIKPSSISSSSSNDDMETTTAPQPISRRRDSLIEQFRDFLSRSVDFTFKIDNPFEKEMY
ncbi:hypothetical protein CRE_29376 [Caenorhabditis remanei]|uniref:Uncharacterized protein n=1 Tax=Caenorhabditis remanei TaxID=31234 RepID=E3MY57_CAERE|nr:hypothetical protein CRE_29376 [Caenorhabditis remanei]